jgi:hypothetical protein
MAVARRLVVDDRLRGPLGRSVFDEIDSWLEELPEAMRWINSGLQVRFDEHFRSLLATAREENDFDGFLHFFEYRQAMIDNMDY